MYTYIYIYIYKLSNLSLTSPNRSNAYINKNEYTTNIESV